MTATAATQHTGHNAAETSVRWGACKAPGRGYELRPDHKVATGRQGGLLQRRAE